MWVGLGALVNRKTITVDPEGLVTRVRPLQLFQPRPFRRDDLLTVYPIFWKRKGYLKYDSFTKHWSFNIGGEGFGLAARMLFIRTIGDGANPVMPSISAGDPASAESRLQIGT